MTELMQAMTDWLGRNPGFGAGMSAMTILTSRLVNIELEVVKTLLQSGVYIVGIVTGILTIIGWFRDRKKRK